VRDEREGFFERYLDPADRLNEILFGLIMVLTFTLTAGLTVEDGPDAGRALLIATIGCNIAWGVIDGAMFVMGALLERSRRARDLALVRAAPDDASAFAVIARATEGTLADYATPEEREALYRTIRATALHTPPPPTRLQKDDLYGAVASGVLVVLPTIPAALPFLFIEAPWRALRVSNFVLVALLFAVGFEWGRYAYVSRWGAGLAFLAAGLALVGVAVALGG
jgi:VIT1/CCC1 family predicted Fe2+/Mn2+ transporter